MKKLMFLMMIALLLVGSQFTQSCAVKGSKPEKEVQKAFELRINGKVDEAKILLDEILAKDSTNAMAWYEMARLKHYMLVGGGDVKTADILATINKAVSLEPENVTYSYYKGIASFLNAFMAMEMGQGEVKNKIAETSAQFEKVLVLKPDYHEARLYLVEIYGFLPAEMGGDSLKAVEQAGKLASMDGYFGAKARAAVASQGIELEKFWEDLLAADAKNPELMMEAGRSYLYKDDPKNAEKYFDQAIAVDPSKKVLILDLARYYIMTVMQNKDLAPTNLPQAKAFLEKYLKSSPEPIIPLKTYAMGLLARVEMFLGNQTEAEKLMNAAKFLDPYFSRASGVPTMLLFDLPDQICHHYFSFFSPF